MRTYFPFVAAVLAAISARGADNRLPSPGFEEGGQHWTIDENVSQIVAEAAHTGPWDL
jgi:hypothetical protein